MKNEFLKNKSITLYRGFNPKSYDWGYIMPKGDGEIEVATVSSDDNICEEIYIKYHSDGEFVHLYGKGMSSHGIFKSIATQNPYQEYADGVFLQFTNENMIVTLGYAMSTDFRFLNKVFKIENSDNESDYEYFEKFDFKEFPKNVYSLVYASYYQNDELYVCYIPTYDLQYKNHVFVKINLIDNIIEKYDIVKFDRYRDGGTTKMELRDSKNNIHKFVYPSHFFNEELPYFDDKMLTLTPQKGSKEYKELLTSIKNILNIDGYFICQNEKV